MLNKIKNLFKRDTNYPKQVLTHKQKSLLDEIDSFLSKRCTLDTANTNMVVKTIKIGLFSQHYGVGYIMGYVQSAVATEGFGYIPRSIALIVDPDGTWSFYYAVRTTDKGCDSTTAELFVNALSRTNDAR